MAFLSSYKIVFLIAGIFLSFCFFSISSKKNEIDKLKNDVIELQNANFDLLNELKNCENKITEQNEAIKKQEVEVKAQESEDINRVKNIYIKDKSCLSELEAYKRLFNEEK